MSVGLPTRLTPEREVRLRDSMKRGDMGWLCLHETLGEIDALRDRIALLERQREALVA